MGLKYYRMSSEAYENLQPLIAAHENDVLGPRARGYWFDRPDDYDYVGVRDTARQLDDAGKLASDESVELSEVQAHGLSLLDMSLPADDLAFPPALFMSSASPAAVRRHLKMANRQLGADADEASDRFVQGDSDPRFSAYLNKQVRHLREALPLVWALYRSAAEADEAVLVVDLRARDIEIPEEFELADAY